MHPRADRNHPEPSPPGPGSWVPGLGLRLVWGLLLVLGVALAPVVPVLGPGPLNLGSLFVTPTRSLLLPFSTIPAAILVWIALERHWRSACGLRTRPRTLWTRFWELPFGRHPGEVFTREQIAFRATIPVVALPGVPIVAMGVLPDAWFLPPLVVFSIAFHASSLWALAVILRQPPGTRFEDVGVGLRFIRPDPADPATAATRSLRALLLVFAALLGVAAMAFIVRRPPSASGPVPDAEIGSLAFRVLDGEAPVAGVRVVLLPDTPSVDHPPVTGAPPCPCPRAPHRLPLRTYARAVGSNNAPHPARPPVTSVLGASCLCAANLALLDELAAGGARAPVELEATTGADGRVRFEALPASVAFLAFAEVPATGASGTVRFALPAPRGETPALRPLRLGRPSPRSFRVVDEDGQPIPGARLAAFSALPFRAFGEGPRFAALPEEDVLIVASAPGYLPSIREHRLTGPLSDSSDVKLLRARCFRGRLTAEGRPVPGVVVEATSGWGVVRASARSDAEGLFVLRGVSRYTRIDATADGRVGSLSFGAGQECDTPGGREIEIPLVPAAFLRGGVREAGTGAAVSAAAVVVYGREGSTWLWTDADGSFATPPLVPGSYELDVSEPAPRRRHVSSWRKIELGPGANTVDVALAPTAEIAGRVVSLAGEPVAGTTVTATSIPLPPDERFFAEAETDAAGFFRLHARDEGPLALQVGHGDGMFVSWHLPRQSLLRVGSRPVLDLTVRGPDGLLPDVIAYVTPVLPPPDGLCRFGPTPRTDASGFRRVTLPTAGLFRVTAEPEGFEPASTWIWAEGEEPDHVELTLRSKK